MCGHTRDPIIYSKFHRNPFRGFGAPGGQNLAFPITLASRFYNSLYYCTSRDKVKHCYLSFKSHSSTVINYTWGRWHRRPHRLPRSYLHAGKVTMPIAGRIQSGQDPGHFTPSRAMPADDFQAVGPALCIL